MDGAPLEHRMQGGIASPQRRRVLSGSEVRGAEKIIPLEDEELATF